MPHRYRHSNPKLWGILHGAAKQMRQEPTPAENLLWQHLRRHQMNGHKFYRQHPVDRFIVDFVCLKPALVIEVDGEIHQQQVEADQERDELLGELGFQVLRFTNEQVTCNLIDVLRQISDALRQTKA